MTVEADLVATLVPLCPRVFPDVAPFDTPRPYLTYQQIGGEVLRPLAREVPDKQNGYFQINVWADTRAGAANLALQIEAALRQAVVFQSGPLSAPIAEHEPDLERYGTRQDFSIW